MTKILVVDDEQNLLKLVRVNLAARGYNVVVGSTGEEGLSLAHSEHPDLVLLDLGLPGMSGREVLAALKGNPDLRRTPVIVVTASVRDGEDGEMRSMGAVGYLPKPFSVEQLMGHINQALGKQ